MVIRMNPLRALAVRSSQTKLEQAVTAAIPGRSYDPTRLPIASPWSSADLERIVWSDIFDGVKAINSRDTAMRLPAISRSRNLTVGTIARFPVVARAGESNLTEQPGWMSCTTDGLSPQLRYGWMVDDLIFSGWSALWRNNTAGGDIETVERVPLDEWETTDDNEVLVNGSKAGASDVILIPGLHEGILNFGRDVLDDTRTLYANVRARILNPVPQLELHQTGGEQMTDTAIDEMIAGWAAARQGQNAGVAYTNEHITINELGAGDAQLMIEARNAAAVDCARLVGVHAGMVDATAPKASLNYETATGRNQEFVDFDLALYMTPITARLSMPDVMPAPGEYAAFDIADFTAPAPSPTGPNLED